MDWRLCTPTEHATGPVLQRTTVNSQVSILWDPFSSQASFSFRHADPFGTPCSPSPKMPSRPAFTDLPLNKSDPFLSAWGLWGPHDDLGTLNFLTNDVVRSAVGEIKDGERVSLNWTFGEPSRPCFERQACEHKVSLSRETLMIDC